MGFNTGARDPRKIAMRFRKYGGEWYIEWTESRATGVIRRKAHDTERRLIEMVVELRRQLRAAPELRKVETLKLKPMTNLKRMTFK
jgi:hypothetical protein